MQGILEYFYLSIESMDYREIKVITLVIES